MKLSLLALRDRKPIHSQPSVFPTTSFVHSCDKKERPAISNRATLSYAPSDLSAMKLSLLALRDRKPTYSQPAGFLTVPL